MVEDGRLCGSRAAGVVVRGDRVQELGPGSPVERGRPLLEQSQAEVDVAEQAALRRLVVGRAGAELRGPADVVEKGRCQQEVGAKPRMQLGRLAADRRDSDCVLEQPARVAVVAVRRRRRERAERRSELWVVEECANRS